MIARVWALRSCSKPSANTARSEGGGNDDCTTQLELSASHVSRGWLMIALSVGGSAWASRSVVNTIASSVAVWDVATSVPAWMVIGFSEEDEVRGRVRVNVTAPRAALGGLRDAPNRLRNA